MIIQCKMEWWQANWQAPAVQPSSARSKLRKLAIEGFILTRNTWIEMTAATVSGSESAQVYSEERPQFANGKQTKLFSDMQDYVSDGIWGRHIAWLPRRGHDAWATIGHPTGGFHKN